MLLVSAPVPASVMTPAAGAGTRQRSGPTDARSRGTTPLACGRSDWTSPLATSLPAVTGRSRSGLVRSLALPEAGARSSEWLAGDGRVDAGMQLFR